MKLTPETVVEDIQRLTDAMSEAMAGGDMSRFLTLSSRRHQLIEWCERSGSDCIPESMKASLASQIGDWLVVLRDRCSDIQSEIRDLGVRKRDKRAVNKAYGLTVHRSQAKHVTNHA